MGANPLRSSTLFPTLTLGRVLRPNPLFPSIGLNNCPSRVGTDVEWSAVWCIVVLLCLFVRANWAHRQGVEMLSQGRGYERDSFICLFCSVWRIDLAWLTRVAIPSNIHRSRVLIGRCILGLSFVQALFRRVSGICRTWTNLGSRVISFQVSVPSSNLLF